jgi:hypothetical protein
MATLRGVGKRGPGSGYLGIRIVAEPRISWGATSPRHGINTSDAVGALAFCQSRELKTCHAGVLIIWPYNGHSDYFKIAKIANIATFL